MKKIVLYFFILTTYLFSYNYDDMFNELEGVTSIIVLDNESKEVIEGAKVQINNLNNFSNDKGIAKYKPTEEELIEEKIVLLTIQKSSYLTYQGNFRVGTDKKTVYLEKSGKKNEITENIKPTKKENILNSKVRVVALDDGILYLADKKLKSIKSGVENPFRIKEGFRTLTLDTKNAVYRKDIKVTAPEMLVVFTKADIIKVKEITVVKAIKDPLSEKTTIPRKVTENNDLKKEKIVKSLGIPENITNEYLISEIIAPLEDGRAFTITTTSNYLEMEEDENKGDFVIYKTPDGKTGKMNKNTVNIARGKIGKTELLDDYYYIVASLEVEFREDYLVKVEKILSKIAVEKKDYISTNSRWNTEREGRYLAFSSGERIENDQILNKIYRISYKNTKKYNDFFEKLDSTISREREYQIRLFDENVPTVVFNVISRGNWNYSSTRTNLGRNEISSTYSSMGSYIDRLNNALLRMVYKNRNEYYFLKNTTARINVQFLKKNDGRKIIRSDYKKVK